MTAPADRNLLFGLLALQNGMIDQSALVAAFHAWTRDKKRSIAEILLGQGAIDANDRTVLDSLVTNHLKRHGDDVEKSLAAVPAPRAVVSDLVAMGDADVDATIGHIGSGSHPTEPDRAADSDATASMGRSAGDGQRFRVLRPHARGGLGAVFVALDAELNREVALKQILDHHADDATSRTGFVLEAEITGGLEHPGIVPVYGLGSDGGGRPYYAMRFIRGDSLKDAIAAFHADPKMKDDPGRRSLALRKLLRRFVDVCNAIEYAHTRGVIHRDIKPANIIVGKYGETLVVDWGLAKAMGKAEPALPSDERTLMPSSASGSAETLPGSAMGTPAYMSPEQAAGDLDRLGPRSDVYSLGATLYCLLTGKPPFEGEDIGAILRAVGKGNFPRPRSVDPSIDPALEAVSLKAMATMPEDRYAGCRALAEDVERWNADEPVTAWREPFGRRARRWAKRNRTGVTSAIVALVVLTGAGAVGGAFVARQAKLAEARSIRAESVLGEVRLFKGMADRAGDDGASWAEASSAAKRAEPLLDDLSNSTARDQARVLVRDTIAGAEGAKRDRAVLDRLVEIRTAKTDDREGSGTNSAYAAAFHEVGIDADGMTPERVGERIRTRPSATASALSVALDDWAAVRRDRLKDRVGAARLTLASRSADSDPWRSQLRDALDLGDKTKRLAVLEALAHSTSEEALPAVSFDLLGQALNDAGDKIKAESVLRRGCRAHPGDVWLNYDLARVLESLSRREEAIRYYTAARMLRPETAHELAHALRMNGESQDAIAVFRDLKRLRPGNGRHLSCLGHALLVRGLREEARKTMAEAVTALRATIAVRPDDFYAHLQLGNTLRFQNLLDEALVAYRKAASLKPESPDPLDCIGWIFIGKGRNEEAASIYRESLRLDEDNVVAIEGLGSALQELGRTDEAIELYRRAMRIAPDDSSLHFKLGDAFAAKGRFAEALAERQESARLTRDDSTVLHGLAVALRDLGRFDEAEAAYRKSIESQPNNPNPLNSLAWQLVTFPDHRQRRPEEALALSRLAVQEAPDVATNINTLGLALYRNGLWDEALATLRRSEAMSKGTDPSDALFLAMTLWRRGENDEARKCFVRGIEGIRKNAPGNWELRMLWSEAAELLSEPSLGPSAYEARAQPDRAMDSLRRAVASGGVDLARLQSDIELNPLRSRPDFQLLRLDLAFPADPFAK